MRTNPREILGRGWAFPFGFDSASGGVAVSEYEENIRQNITIILGTKPGERQMLPAFGCRIHELMFAPNTRNTSAIVAHHVEEALARWENRIQVLKVTADADPSGSIKVEVSYKIVATDAIQNLVLAIGG
jgi:phage baseplate assembly protein W